MLAKFNLFYYTLAAFQFFGNYSIRLACAYDFFWDALVHFFGDLIILHGVYALTALEKLLLNAGYANLALL